MVGAPDPLGSGQDVGKFSVKRQDENPCCSYAGRADLDSPELMSPTQNSNVYISIPVYVPMSTIADAYGSTNNGFMVDEPYGAPFDGAPAAGNVDVVARSPESFNYRFCWNDFLGTYDPPREAACQWLSPTITSDGWHTITLHINWSGNPSLGYTELWFDGAPQRLIPSPDTTAPGAPLETGTAGPDTRIYFSNFNGNNDSGPNFNDVNLYGNQTSNGSTEVIYHGETKIGTTLASVAPDVYPEGP